MYDAVGYVGVAVAVALETIVAPIPSEVILPMAGWKVSQSAADASVLEPLTGLPWNIPLAVLLATVGSVVGATVGYFIGAWGGRPLLDRYGRYVGIGADDLNRADRWFDRWGSWAVFLGRMVPLVRTFVSYPAGISRMPMGRFLLFSTLGLAAVERGADLRRFRGRRELSRDRGRHQAVRVRHLRGRGRVGRAVRRPLVVGEAATVDQSRPYTVYGSSPGARLTAIQARATIGRNRTIHRLRGGVKVPTGGRLSSLSQPANRIGH